MTSSLAIRILCTGFALIIVFGMAAGVFYGPPAAVTWFRNPKDPPFWVDRILFVVGGAGVCAIVVGLGGFIWSLWRN